MSEIISSKDIQPVVIQVASAEDAATLARIETGIRTAAQNVVQGYLTIGSYWSSRAARRAVWAIYRIRWILRPLSAYLSARRVSSRTWAPRWPTWTAASGGNWRAMWT